jgi:hypothetical protein
MCSYGNCFLFKLITMEKTGEIVHDLYTNTREYVNLQTKSVKLEIYERVTNVISSGISAGFIALFGLFSFLFINFGLAYYLSDLFESRTAGFFTVGGFYFVVLGIYLLLKDKVAKNELKNSILLNVSKTMNDYDELLKEQEDIHVKVAAAEIVLKANLDALKQKADDLKGNFIPDPDAHKGPKVPRMIMTSAVDFILQKFILKNSGFLIKQILPVVANTLLTSKVFNEEKKTSLLENLKLKLSKFL